MMEENYVTDFRTAYQLIAVRYIYDFVQSSEYF